MNVFELPSTWIWIEIDKILEIVGGGTPSRNNSDYFGGDILWATPKDVTDLDNLWIEKTKEKITHSGLKNSSAKLLPCGAVLMTSRATIGATAIAHYPMATNQGFANFICNKNLLDNEYLAYWLPSIKPYLLNLAGGTTFKEIAKSALKKIKIPLPPLLEQRRIVAILREADEIRCLRKQANEKRQKFLQSVFFELFGNPEPNLARGGSQANLNLSILKNLEIPMPDLNLQQRFEVLVDEYLQLEALSTTSGDKIDSLFKSLLSNAFTGELTAAWRNQHQAQLAAAAAERYRLLQISQPVDTEELADEEASETKSSELHRDRYELLRNLSKSQRKIYESVIQETAYFTPERLEEKYFISLNIGKNGLQLLAAAGLIVPVTLPTPTSSGLRYELAYRNLNEDDTRYSDVA